MQSLLSSNSNKETVSKFSDFQYDFRSADLLTSVSDRTTGDFNDFNISRATRALALHKSKAFDTV